MGPYGNSLNNANLDETPMSASSYNELPHINTMHSAAQEHVKAHAKLLGLIASHGLADTFSVHLVHKHFDMPEGRVMVYETVRGPNHPEFVLSSPRDPAKTENLRGLYFRATPEGKMAAYEYTTDVGADLRQHAAFVEIFSKAVMAWGVQDVFALTVQLAHRGVLTEFEMSDLKSTVLVDNPTGLPAAELQISTSTDWIATSDYAKYADEAVPGIITLKCMETRPGRHYNFTCSSTRNGSHYQSRGNLPDGELWLGDQPLAADSEAFAVISRARGLVDCF